MTTEELKQSHKRNGKFVISPDQVVITPSAKIKDKSGKELIIKKKDK